MPDCEMAKKLNIAKGTFSKHITRYFKKRTINKTTQ